MSRHILTDVAQKLRREMTPQERLFAHFLCGFVVRK